MNFNWYLVSYTSSNITDLITLYILKVPRKIVEAGIMMRIKFHLKATKQECWNNVEQKQSIGKEDFLSNWLLLFHIIVHLYMCPGLCRNTWKTAFSSCRWAVIGCLPCSAGSLDIWMILFIHSSMSPSIFAWGENQCWLNRGHLVTFPARICCGENLLQSHLFQLSYPWYPSHVIVAVSPLLCHVIESKHNISNMIKDTFTCYYTERKQDRSPSSICCCHDGSAFHNDI